MSLETSWENTPASAGHKASMSDGYDFSALRILVVDDSFHMRELVRTFLEGFGIKEVTVSSDAEEAYDIVVGMDPDLIITDWNMAPVSGLEFVERIRKGANVPNRFVPIIMLTGYTEMKRVEEARDAGINSFLAKPISAASLYKRWSPRCRTSASTWNPRAGISARTAGRPSGGTSAARNGATGNRIRSCLKPDF